MEKIYSSFANMFKPFGLQLPNPLPSKGMISDKGWTIQYALLEDENHQPYLEYLAEHRMTNARHVRILANGEVLDLPSFEDTPIYDPGIPGDRETAEARMKANNEAVLADLKSKGIL